MRRKIAILAILIITFVLIVGVGCMKQQKIEYVFAAASPGGTYFSMSGGISQVFSQLMESVSLTVQTSSGSAENVRLINFNEADLGLANGSELYWAWHGEEVFEGQSYQDIRIVTFGWTNVYHAAVMKDSGIESFEHLIGKKVGVGPQGSAVAIFDELLFKKAGIWDKITPVYLPPADQLSAIKDGNLSVFSYFSGLPLSLITDLASSRQIRLLDVGNLGDELNFRDQYPFFDIAIIPSGTYSGQDEDVVTYANLTYVIANKNVSEEKIYDFMKALYSEEGLNIMKATHSSAVELREESIDKMVEKLGIPLHKGTEKFLKEIRHE
ncbi:MAG: TAXI family TRAP transporter solute-binding subunit [Tissierellales bacterium]|nr:TAXI family TRAP transporter solute-binding subunit [Tissierellales bacterium]MBN2827273.1 TAXI family TRAP transporter solute-binding subunit [Tissierellales bacterium]